MIAKRTLREFWAEHPDAENPLKAWYQEVNRARWQTPHDVKAHFRTASVLKNSRVVFNVAGNKYRIVVAISYRWQKVWVRFIGTHEQYDQINAEIV